MNPSESMIVEACRTSLGPQIPRLGALRNTTLVVTGGTGFLGKWIAEAVRVLNDEHGFGIECHLISRNTARFSSQCAHLAGRKDLILQRDDVRYLVDLPREASWVVHAAGTPDNREHATNPLDVMSSISQGTDNAVRVAARLSQLRMFLNVSSGLVYGSQPLDLMAIPETAPGTLPSNDPSVAYSEAKRYAETLCAAMRTQMRVPTATVRPFTVVGPYQSLETPWAINNFLRDALRGKTIRILGNGKTVRTYMYGSDFATWVLTILTNTKAGRAYNVGNPKPVTMEEAARMVSDCMNPKPEISVGSNVAAYPHLSRFVPDTKAAETDFGLTCVYPPAVAIERTVAWHRSVESQA